MHQKLCITDYASQTMHQKLCITDYASQTMHQKLCINGYCLTQNTYKQDHCLINIALADLEYCKLMY